MESIEHLDKFRHEITSLPADTLEQSLNDTVAGVVARKNFLAHLVVGKTKRGRVRDKEQYYEFLLKNLHYNSLDWQKQHNKNTYDIARPKGIIAAVLTNSDPIGFAITTILHSLKSRCSLVILAPSAELSCIQEFCKLLPQVSWVKHSLALIEFSEAKWQQISRHPKVNLLLAAASKEIANEMSYSGKPSLGTSPGINPTIVDETANIHHAAECVAKSICFDHGLHWGREGILLVASSIASKFCEALQQQSIHFLDRETDLDRITHLVGNAPINLGKNLNITIPTNAKAIAQHLKFWDLHHPALTHPLLPVLPIHEFGKKDEAIEIAEAIFQGEYPGLHSTLHTQSEEFIWEYTYQVNSPKILVNSPGSQGLMGLTTSLVPSSVYLGGSGKRSITTANLHFEHFREKARLTTTESNPMDNFDQIRFRLPQQKPKLHQTSSPFGIKKNLPKSPWNRKSPPPPEKGSSVPWPRIS